jgi:glycosidase
MRGWVERGVDGFRMDVVKSPGLSSRDAAGPVCRGPHPGPQPGVPASVTLQWQVHGDSCRSQIGVLTTARDEYD